MRPNFIFILADDLGYADLGCYGGRAPISPNIDVLAAEGLRFTQGYANSPVCSPTRFALATGRYQYRVRGAAEEPLTARARGDKKIGLPPEHPTIASILRDAGYCTALIGKWHLGYPPHFGPLKSGYDEFFGPHSGAVDYHRHTARGGNQDLFDNDEPAKAEGYLTDLLSQRAADFATRCAKSNKPFLLSLHYNAPHWPWQTREDSSEPQSIFHLDGGSIHIYRRMIQQMDEGIGEVMRALERNGQRDNTLIVFTSDNGGERFSDNWPLVGGKMDLTEGGIRVPYVARWPAVISPGRVSEQLLLTMDWTATFFEAAGASAHRDYPLDGISLMPVLRNAHEPQSRQLFWRMKYHDQKAMRGGDWKYLSVGEYEYLFNLSEDERERANLSGRHPDRLAAMRETYAAWDRAIGPIPPDAHVEIVYTDRDMPPR